MELFCKKIIHKSIFKMREDENIFTDVLHNNTYFEVLCEDLINWYYQYQITLWTAVLIMLIARFLLPTMMFLLLYITVFYLKAFQCYYKINGYAFTPKCWEGARSILAYFWDLQGRFWYGYEIEGLDKIPDKGAALIVFYHGPNPIDFYFLLAKTVMYKKRHICVVGERFISTIPGFGVLIECFQICQGTVETCADILKKGNLLAIAPGGAREAIFGDEMYSLMWGTRKGFAKVAIEAKVPIIPVFTENIREAFSVLSFGKKWLRAYYERTRIPVLPVTGGFPVKLKTFVGQPIEYEPGLSPEELTAKVADQMNKMIKKHQQLPASVCRSILQRIQHIFKARTS